MGRLRQRCTVHRFRHRSGGGISTTTTTRRCMRRMQRRHHHAASRRRRCVPFPYGNGSWSCGRHYGLGVHRFRRRRSGPDVAGATLRVRPGVRGFRRRRRTVRRIRVWFGRRRRQVVQFLRFGGRCTWRAPRMWLVTQASSIRLLVRSSSSSRRSRSTLSEPKNRAKKTGVGVVRKIGSMTHIKTHTSRRNFKYGGVTSTSASHPATHSPKDAFTIAR